MGNNNSCVTHLRGLLCVRMGGAREGEDVDARSSPAGEDAPCLSSRDVQLRAAGRDVGSDVVARASASGADVVSIEVKVIESGKAHWSELSEFDSGIDDEEVAAENREVFKELRSHPTFGPAFFRTFNYDFEGWGSDGSLEIGEKFGEGGQAELFHAKVTWTKWKYNEWDRGQQSEWVLKVFKKGTRLRELQSQWPNGMLQFHVDECENWRSTTPKQFPRYMCAVHRGILLKDGRFAFLMVKEDLDLRTLIDCNMLTPIDKNYGPFSKEEAEECMFEVAHGMSWLHYHNIVHRDLKASNVLLKVHDAGEVSCFVADYECSVGVVGTGFFRAPEILQAIKDKVICSNPQLFTKAADVYSYGMTCYEILTGRLPFQGHGWNDYDLIFNGNRPKVPRCVDAWMGSLLRECWKSNPLARPTFDDVVNTMLDNSPWIKELVENGSYKKDSINWVNWRS